MIMVFAAEAEPVARGWLSRGATERATRAILAESPVFRLR